jgi:hypothetical protein
MTSAPNVCQWSASRPRPLYLVGKCPLVRRLDGLHSRLEAVEKIKIYCPYQELNPGRSSRNLSLYRLSYFSCRPRTIQEHQNAAKLSNECFMGFGHHASIGFAGVYVLKAVIREIFYHLVIYFIHPHGARFMANSIQRVL